MIGARRRLGEQVGRRVSRESGGRDRDVYRQEGRRGKILVALRAAMCEVNAGGEILAGTAMIVSGESSLRAGGRFGRRAFAAKSLLDGGATAISDAQDKVRSQPLSGREED